MFEMSQAVQAQKGVRTVVDQIEITAADPIDTIERVMHWRNRIEVAEDSRVALDPLHLHLGDVDDRRDVMERQQMRMELQPLLVLGEHPSARQRTQRVQLDVANAGEA